MELSKRKRYFLQFTTMNKLSMGKNNGKLGKLVWNGSKISKFFLKEKMTFLELFKEKNSQAYIIIL